MLPFLASIDVVIITPKLIFFSILDEQIEGDRALAEKLQLEVDDSLSLEDDSLSLVNQAKGEIGSTASTVPLTLQEALDNIRACHDVSSAMHSSCLIQRSKVWNNVI